MEFLSADKVAVMDLASGEVSEDELSEELVQEKIGGAGIAKTLYEEHLGGDPMILGAGLFTGSLVPGSSLGLLSGKSPVTGSLAHAPLCQYAGAEIKYSGFDYLVIKGKAAEPSILWVHDGIVDLEPAGGLWGMDVWSAVDKVRQDKGDSMIQVLGVGPAAEGGSDLGQVMINHWASGDRFGLGKALAAKNIKLIAVRGMGLLEIAEEEDFVAGCGELLAAVKAGSWAGKAGLGELGKALGFDDFGDWLAPLVHRHHAAFNTPFAYNTFVFLEGDPGQKAESADEEPGMLLADPAAPGAFRALGLDVKEACGIIRECAKLGLDAASAAHICGQKGLNDAAAIQGALAGLAGPVEGLAGPFSPFAPEGLAPGAADWRHRQAVAYLFGLDPVFALLAPEISEEKLLELVTLGTELEVSAEALDAAIAYISA